MERPYKAAVPSGEVGPGTLNPSAAGLGKPNKFSVTKPTKRRNGLKRINAQSTPNTLKIVCDIAARLACVLPIEAAILAVIVVPMFSPNTMAQAMPNGIQPILNMMSVMAMVAEEDWRTRVRIVPKRRNNNTEPNP